MTCCDRLPKSVPRKYFNFIKAAPVDARSKVAGFEQSIIAVKHVKHQESDRVTDKKDYVLCHVSFQSTGGTNISTVNALLLVDLYVRDCSLGWEIRSKFCGIPQLIRFRTFWTPEFLSEFYFSDRKMCSLQFWTRFFQFRILSRHQFFQFHESENVPAIFVSGIILRQTSIYSLLLLIFE